MTVKETQNATLRAKEAPSSRHIPYSAQIDAHTLKTRSGDFVRTIRLDGIPHTTSPDEVTNAWHESRHHTLLTIASPQVGVWTHLVRRRTHVAPSGGAFESGFATSVDAKYRGLLGSTSLYANELYLSLIYRPAASRVGGLINRFRDRVDQDERRYRHEVAMERIAELTDEVMKGFADYRPHLLGTYEHQGMLCSEPAEFAAFLLNGYWQRMPLPRRDLSTVLQTARPFFGKNLVELSDVEGARLGGVLGVKEYAPSTRPTMLDSLLDAPYEFVLTQSFTYETRARALHQLEIQVNRMDQAEDAAVSQMEDLVEAMDHVQSGRLAMGHHHLTLLCYGDSVRQLGEHLTDAKQRLADGRFVVAREDLGMEAAYWAQQPAAWSYRPRPSLITSRNVAALASFHNYPSGLREARWGGPLSVLRTTGRTPYYFHYQASDDKEAAGNTAIVGQTGTGKTVLMGFLILQALKINPRVMVWDKDRGMEIAVRANGGTYFVIEPGRATGFNPLQLEMNPANRAFLNEWLRTLIRGEDGYQMTTAHHKQLEQALDGISQMPQAERRLTNLRHFLDTTDTEGPAGRLARWCEGNEFGWLFDNPTDDFALDARVCGVDVTDLLDRPVIRTPTMQYLYHRANEMITGYDPFMLMVDEGWKALDDEVFAPKLKNDLKVIRKRNGVVVFSTQSPADAIKSTISDTIIEQSITKIFLPNPAATWEQYKALGANEKEFEIVRRLGKKSRQFLIKQDDRSVLCELNLNDMPDEVAVLSGTEANISVLHECINDVGANPEDWLPEFYKRRR
ncbi:VirB4 family type IV secretion/conjugal transfer ATPase [Arhodomonas sp. AD133]|uniref:VirB4 family type IV secretion/conjugal transfer ATPase n=1 Tax=Arhodomonas sp. AD133 TaxID=3415009 RepID=UPI003EBE0692